MSIDDCVESDESVERVGEGGEMSEASAVGPPLARAALEASCDMLAE
jgi:hypothetical protein